jgi:hypothetical protein
LDASGFESPRVSSLELVGFLESYATPILRELVKHSDEIKELDGGRYGVALVLAHFLSILHPKYRVVSTTKVELVDAYSGELSHSLKVSKEMR